MHFISKCVSHLHYVVSGAMVILYMFYFSAFYNIGYFFVKSKCKEMNYQYIYEISTD